MPAHDVCTKVAIYAEISMATLDFKKLQE
jgi:hypothetical protein